MTICTTTSSVVSSSISSVRAAASSSTGVSCASGRLGLLHRVQAHFQHLGKGTTLLGLYWRGVLAALGQGLLCHSDQPTTNSLQVVGFPGVIVCNPKALKCGFYVVPRSTLFTRSKTNDQLAGKDLHTRLHMFKIILSAWDSQNSA